jgi:ABC-2 type transport system permease protein
MIFAVVHPLLGIPMGKNTLPFMGVVFIFIATNAMLGMMVSSIFKDENIAMDASFIYNSPAFVFSGFTFPILAMPSFDKWYAQIIPYTHFLKAFTKGVEMNTQMSFLNQHVISLLIFFLVGYVVTSVVLFFRFKNIEG